MEGGKTVCFRQWFKEKEYDITLMELSVDQGCFNEYLPILTRKVLLEKAVHVLSLINRSIGGVGLGAPKTNLFYYDPDTAIFRASYYSNLFGIRCNN